MGLAALLVFFALVPLARSAGAQDTALEEIEAVDPYTKGEPIALERLGIVRVGAMPWTESHSSSGVVDALGGIPVIFIETAHFRLASTLESYRPTGDRPEKEALDAEFAALKKKIRGLKVPPKIDPWLRAHLYAQRLERIYSEFTRAFSIREEDFESLEAKAAEGRPMGQGPYLGQKQKFTVLLTQTQSAMGRYLKAHFNVEPEYSYRAKWPDGYFVTSNFEALKAGGRDLDIALHTALAGAVAQNLLDGFRDSFQTPPDWLRYGLAHWVARRVDPRWNQWNAGGSSNPDEDKNYLWEPRVWGLVKNEACTPWSEMVRWAKYEEIKPREHMVAWAAVDWILTARADTARALLFELSEPIADFSAERPAKIVEQQLRAFQKVWSQSPEQLDEPFRAWILKHYRK